MIIYILYRYKEEHNEWVLCRISDSKEALTRYAIGCGYDRKDWWVEQSYLNLDKSE